MNDYQLEKLIENAATRVAGEVGGSSLLLLILVCVCARGCWHLGEIRKATERVSPPPAEEAKP